jgi:solute carrier family 6 (neurotransmitter transporter)
MSLGQYLSAGIVDMWRISPIFTGIGAGLLISQALIGLYTAVGVSWMFIYFRDSFVTRLDQYRWGKCVRELRDYCDPSSSSDGGYSNNNDSSFHNHSTYELTHSVPDYFK